MDVPELVERSDPEGVDYGWVMQVTFVVTIAVGAPIVAALSTLVTLPTWGARVAFAVRVGAVIWFLTAVGVYVYARRTRVEGATTAAEAQDARAETRTDAADTTDAADAAEVRRADDADEKPTRADAPAESDATTD